ncbi:hypothetical protein M408DRAFT_310106 [Serendipita vermifera MAFF 305830]|uniref:Uncharacterized protein n=1 Tax=Serendipita vermifera MAFF 305830 TaxID=933852 RepID=A0A0C3BNI7_SERVB|nr:hypothetical protein M408DRAFT_310106 [Serendipita vermifera MAFF 305830]
MLILLLAYYLAQSVHSKAGLIPASIDLREVASYDGQYSQRSLVNIVWSCLSTIFLCTWVAVHPNVHFRAEKQNQRWTEKWLWDPLHEIITYKLPLFLWALLVPEYILSWAIRQYLQAGVISAKVPGWTRTHGHFMIMGGFHLFRLPADAPCIESSKSANFIVAPAVTELKDRGKSDALTKILVLVQTLWFVIQCIARGFQRLPLPELEVVTLAYATLNLFSYVFWWDKPRNVECPIRVYKTSTVSHKEAGKQAKEWDENWVERWPWMILWYTVGAQDDYITLSEETSIPMFWSGRIDDNHLGSAGLGASILGSAFGGIHCIAWSSEFPSRSELVLWRVSCAAMVAVPFTVTLFCATMAIDYRMGQNKPWWVVITMFLCLILLVLSAWFYVASRIATLIIAFTTLRSLPPTAFTTVDWTTFIPHI